MRGCDKEVTKRSGDFGRRMIRRGWRTRNTYTARRGEIAGSPSGSEVTYVFSLFASLTRYGELRRATHLPGTTIELFTRGAELILLYQLSRNETTATLIPCRKTEFTRKRIIHADADDSEISLVDISHFIK